MSHEGDPRCISKYQQFKEGIMGGIEEHNGPALLQMLLDIDEKLTGNEDGFGRPGDAMYEIVRENVRELVEQRETVFYLSDGGYSRLAIWVDEDGLHAEPTYNSMDHVVKNWQALGNMY